jgi:hypothetical protein
MVRLPDGDDALELVKFHAPGAEGSTDSAPPNRPGMRHLAFQVDDLHAVVDRMCTAGWDTVGEIVDYDAVFLLCYLRRPRWTHLRARRASAVSSPALSRLDTRACSGAQPTTCVPPVAIGGRVVDRRFGLRH